MHTLHVSAALALLFLSGARGAEPAAPAGWPSWRGPLNNGIAPGAEPPLRWDRKTNIRWKAAVPGRGSSTPIVWGDQVFVLTAVDTGREAAAADIPTPHPELQKRTQPPTTYHQWLVLSFDRQTGKERWRHVAREAVPHEGHHSSHSYAAFSPTTDGQRLYVNFGSQGVYCYDLDGKLLWQRRDLGRLETRLGWGEAVSPVIYQDSLIVNGDQDADSWLVVLDAATGKTKWRVERDEPTTWATPLVVEHRGTTQLIVHGTSRVRAYDLGTGKVLWEVGGHSVNAIPSPLHRDGIVYVMSGYRSHLAQAISLDGRGDLTGTKHVLWEYTRGTPYVPSPLLLGDRLYFTMSLLAALTSLDVKTGKVVIDRQRIPGLENIYASPAAAGDRIYITGRDGTTTVLQAGDEIKVLAVNKLDDPIDASPAIVGKQLFLRSMTQLYCIEEQ